MGHTCDERLAWDRYGSLWMTHLEAVGPVFVGLSTDGGLRFRKVADILPPAPFGQHVADRPSVSVGPHSVWVSYTNVLSEPQARVGGLRRQGHRPREIRGVQPRPKASLHGTGTATSAASPWVRTARSW